MSRIRSKPLFTTEYGRPADMALEPGGTYLYSVGDEPRSRSAEDVQAANPGTTFVRITAEHQSGFSTDHPLHATIATRRRGAIDRLLEELVDPLHVDITGLDHRTWAPIVRTAIERRRALRVVYMEPASYSASVHPEVGTIYDLSTEIGGIGPLPQFARIVDRADQEATFIALLGFEGPRLLHMLNEMEPSLGKVVPILGVPGFMPHYPLDAVIANNVGLEQGKAIRNLRLAKSNCPFSLFYELEEVADARPDDLMRIGLVGTKPHALGAVIFAIANEERTEIVYDNALRRSGRTSGVRKCLVYSVSDFLYR